MDHFCLCMDPSIVPDVGCTETVNQRIGVGGMLAESHTISFNIVRETLNKYSDFHRSAV